MTALRPEGSEHAFWIQPARIRNPALPLGSPEASGKGRLLSVPRFPSLGSGVNNCICFIGLLWWLQESMHLKCVAWHLTCDKHSIPGWRNQGMESKASWKAQLTERVGIQPSGRMISKSRFWTRLLSFLLRVSESVICGEPALNSCRALVESIVSSTH